METNSKFLFWVLLLLPLSCSQPDKPLFQLRDGTGVQFSNDLGYADEFNVYRYRNFYNGGGVAIGDVNQDGLADLFFTVNQGPNRLYLNQGDWTFDDITVSAGIAGTRTWSTGVSMADVNGDGWLDIYVCNSGIVADDDKRNELYLNNGDGSFTEAAADYGLDDPGLSIHGSFFDYDKDGDLDLYLVNNSFKSIQDFDLTVNTRHIRNTAGGDRLFRNDLIHFTDVSEEAGIYGSEIGFGLGVSVGDVNRDSWPDLYISNDFFERDYLYINNGDGTFSEALESSIKSVSAAAMGADIADLDGDGFLDIFVTDMLPSDEKRLKTLTTFDSWIRYQDYLRDDYYHQFTRNTLHMNLGPAPGRAVHFAEVGRYADVHASDWSWGALIADFDHDGIRDVFVANGVFQDLTDRDYLDKVGDEETVRALTKPGAVDWATLIDMIPSNPVSNHLFAGEGDFHFVDRTQEWGLDAPSYSNGSAYGDLDNDGDLDLVINNLGQPPSLYENRSTRIFRNRAWLQLDLQGSLLNSDGVGASIIAWSDNHSWYAEQQPVRGYQSSVDPVVHLGLGNGVKGLDSLIITWPSGSISRFEDIKTNQRIIVSENAEAAPTPFITSSSAWLRPVSPQNLGLSWRHQESSFNDFLQQPLLFHMRSTEGPAICSGDANGDGHPDLYLGGAKDQEGSVWIASSDGYFSHRPQDAFEEDSIAEDTDCLWFDSDGDGDQDLIVGSGSSEFPTSSSALVDRLYLNDGAGIFIRSESFFPVGRQGFEPTGALAAVDFDNDNDIDLFIGTRLLPFSYGIPADGHLYVNDGNGMFTEQTDALAPSLRNLGMITDAIWNDLDGDGDQDLVVVGEWMPVTFFVNEDGMFSPLPQTGTEGWWNTVHVTDLNKDNTPDLIVGNHGLNSRFRAPVQLWTSDFDRNGRIEQILALNHEGLSYPMALRHDLVQQIPFIALRYPTYKSFAGATVHDIFSPEQLDRAIYLEAIELRSMAFINDGQGLFSRQALPNEAQLSPIYSALALDLNGNGSVEILMGGNLYEAKPEAGRYDASFGITLDSDLQPIRWNESGFWVDGPIRKLLPLQVGDQMMVLAALNNDALRVFTYEP